METVRDPPSQAGECLKPLIGLLRSDPCRSHSTGRTCRAGISGRQNLGHRMFFLGTLAVGPLEKGHARYGHCPNVAQDGDRSDRDDGDNDGQE